MLAHFSNLYRLDEDYYQIKPLWCPLCPLQQLVTRPKPGYKALPVQDCSNSGDPRYLNSWVAEVIMVRPVADAVRGYMQLRGTVSEREAGSQCNVADILLCADMCLSGPTTPNGPSESTTSCPG